MILNFNLNIFSNGYDDIIPGGLNVFSYYLSHYLDNVIHITVDNIDEDEIVREIYGKKEYIVKGEFAFHSGTTVSNVINMLYRILDENEIKIALLNDPFYPYVIPILKRHKIKVVYICHFPHVILGNDVAELKAREKYMVREADVVIANSSKTKSILDSNYNIKSVEIDLGVDKRIFKKKKFTENRKVLIMSRFEAYKIEEIITMIHTYYPKLYEEKIEFTFVGNGGIVHNVVALTSTNIVSVREVRNIYDKVDIINEHEIFLSSSRWEPYGLSLAENLACGRICVVSDAHTLVRDGENGFLFRTSNVDDMFNTLMKAIHLPRKEKNRISDNAVSSARDFREFINEFKSKLAF